MRGCVVDGMDSLRLFVQNWFYCSMKSPNLQLSVCKTLSSEPGKVKVTVSRAAMVDVKKYSLTHHEYVNISKVTEL